MDRNNILIAEYQTCQQHINSLGSQSWISISIIFSTNAVLVAGLGYALLPQNSNGLVYHLVLTLVICILAVVMILFMWLLMIPWWRRLRYQIFVYNLRMQKIENEIMVDTLNNLSDKPKNQVLSDLKIKAGDANYKAKAILIPIINSEASLMETMIVFEYIQKKKLQM